MYSKGADHKKKGSSGKPRTLFAVGGSYFRPIRPKQLERNR